MPPSIAEIFLQTNHTLEYDRGRGIIACNAIKKSEQILNEMPIWADEFGWMLLKSTRTCEKFRVDEDAKLPREIHDYLMNMGNRGDNSFSYQNGEFFTTPVSGTIRSNSFPFSLGTYQSRADQVGIFFMMSKLNHSCHPNAAQTWNPQTRHETLYALEDIKAGEQITISWSPQCRIDPKWVEKILNFQCSCRWYLMPDSPAKRATKINTTMIEFLAKNLEVIEDMDLALENCYTRILLIHKENISDWRKGLAYEDALDILSENHSLENMQ